MAPPRDVQLRNKRMDLVSQLDKSIFVLIVYGYLLDPAFLVLILRGITQTQISRPHESHPTSSLRTMTILLLFNYCVTTSWIVLFGSTGTEREVKGVFLDFVGQATPTRPLHLHLLSLLLLILQSLCLLVAFESTPSTQTPVPTPIPTPGSPPPIPMPATLGTPTPPAGSASPTPSPTPTEADLAAEHEEGVRAEDFLSLWMRRRRRSNDEGEEEDREEEDSLIKHPPNHGDEEDEGGSIMVLRILPTLGKLLGFWWGWSGDGYRRLR